MSTIESAETAQFIDPPDFLTVEEAAAVVRIGRTAAYRLARLYLATAGVSGLPVVRLGRQLRVPLCSLEAMKGGPITWPPPPTRPTPAPVVLSSRRRARRRTTSSSPQSSLPFSG